MTLWNGRFEDQPDSQMWDLNASIGFDQRIALQDVRGSQAWAEALESAGILSSEEKAQICEGLQQIEAEFRSQSFAFAPKDEDIHTAVERRLSELIGTTAGKLHTGRSRNDQVATDFRLWLMDHLPTLDAALAGLQAELVARAESDMGTTIPGYTHLQRAQPLLLSHWWLSHFWPLLRDRERLNDLQPRLDHFRDYFLEKLTSGELSPIGYYMGLVELTEADAAARMGLSKRQVRKHMKPEGFGRIGQKLMLSYCDLLGTTEQELRQVPLPEGGVFVAPVGN